MINKKIICLGIFLILLILIDKKTLQESAPVVKEEFPLKYVRKNEAIEFNADIVIENDSLYESTATKMEFNKDVFIPVMFENNVTNISVNTDGTNYIHANGNTMYIEGNYLSYNSNSEKEKNIMKKFSLYTERYTGNQYELIEKSDELSAITDKNDIEQLFDSLGINNSNLYKTYVVDGQKTYGNKSNDARYWIGCEMCQGLPVFCSSFYAGIIDAWAPMQILYTENGIEKLQILYYFNFEKSAERIVLKTFDEIADALVRKYSMLLTDNKHIVTKAELSFWIDVNQDDTVYKMVPVWVFTMREYSKKSDKGYLEYQELVKATTAELLEVGE